MPVDMKNKDTQNINHKQLLTDIWKEALQLDNELAGLDVTDNFFALGGDSIQDNESGCRNGKSVQTLKWKPILYL